MASAINENLTAFFTLTAYSGHQRKHQTFSTMYQGNPPITGGSPHKAIVMRIMIMMIIIAMIIIIIIIIIIMIVIVIVMIIITMTITMMMMMMFCCRGGCNVVLQLNVLNRASDCKSLRQFNKCHQHTESGVSRMSLWKKRYIFIHIST